MRKLCETLRQAMEQAGLRDGMTISFHHHLRNGDYVLNMVLDEAAKMGVKDLTVNASSVFDCYEPMLDHIRNGVVTGLETDYIAPGIGRELSKGILPKPIIFRTHGSRPADILSGRSLIDIAFIAAPASDSMGNCSGKYGPSACGSLGYAFADAMKAKKVVVITDHLMDYPLTDASITEDYVDYVVNVPAIGRPSGHRVGHDPYAERPDCPQDCRPRRTGHRCFRSAERWLLLSDWCRRRFAGRCRIPQANHAAQEHQGQLCAGRHHRAISSECWKPDALLRFRTCSALT